VSNLEDRLQKAEDGNSSNEISFREQLSHEKQQLAKDLEEDYEAILKEIKEQENKVVSKLQEQVESLQSDIAKIGDCHFDLESFKK